MYGFYSRKAAETFGSSIYRHVSGDVVEVTCVCPTMDSSIYKWDDKVYVGEVTNYICSGSYGSSSMCLRALDSYVPYFQVGSGPKIPVSNWSITKGSKMTTPKKIVVMQAFVDKKKIQFRKRFSGEEWQDIVSEELDWNWTVYEYRIKPEPRHFWMNIYPNERCKVYTSAYTTKESAVTGKDPSCLETIEVVEVIK